MPHETTITKDVPAAALRFAADEVRFAAGEADSANVPVRILARTAQPIRHWWFGKTVHDMSGFSHHKPSLPLDYVHSDQEILGFLNEFHADEQEGLRVAGELTPFGDADRASEVIHKAKAGVPYEASIFFDPASMVVEDVPELATAEVNGYEIEGPATIIRQWTLRGVAICPYGADPDTSTQFSAGDQVAVTFLEGANSMAKKPTGKKPKTKLSEQAAEAAAAADVDAESQGTPPADDAPETPPDDQAAAPKDPPPAGDDAPGQQSAPAAKTGKDFIAAFGDKGAVWFVEGKPFGEATQLYIGQLKADNQELAADAKQLSDRLASLALSDEEAAEFTPETDPNRDDSTAPSAEDVDKFGANRARHVAGIRASMARGKQ